MNVTTIIICRTCNGSGRQTVVERVSGHDSNTENKMCTACEGSGRQICKVCIILEPYKP